jgi:hypothetical protein
MRWVVYVAHLGERCIRVTAGKLEGKSHLGNVGIHGRIILKWSSQQQNKRVWTRFIWLRIRTNGGIL